MILSNKAKKAKSYFPVESSDALRSGAGFQRANSGVLTGILRRTGVSVSRIRSLAVFALFFAIILANGSCTSSDDKLSSLLNNRIEDPMDSNRVIRVLFASNRAKGDTFPSCNDVYFKTARGEKLRYGACDVNVPAAHAVGALDEGDSSEDSADEYFRMGNYHSLDQDKFFDLLSKEKGDLILFVHGFNVPFKEAVYRSAQIAYDSKFQGQIVLFTWPSGPLEGIFNKILLNRTYDENLANAKSTVPQFAEFLNRLTKLDRHTNVIIHSMGHQVVLPAIAELHKKRGRKFIEELILNAPDFPAEGFKEIAPDLTKSAKRVTLYCSPADNALAASEVVNNNKRAGSCEKVDGVDVINVRNVDEPVVGIGGLGHGYYSSRFLMTDLYQVLLGIDVEKRLFLQRSEKNGTEDYIMRR